MFLSHVMGTFGTNRVYSVGRIVKVKDRMRWGFAPAWVRFPPYLNAKFITESEFYSVSQCALDCVYLRRIMELLGYQQTVPTLIVQDNNACIFFVKGSGMYACAKHIDTRIHRVREFAAGDKPEVKL